MITVLTINEWVVFSYFLIGFIFIFYFVLTMTQTRIDNRLRLSLSGLFLTCGFFFTNSAAKLYYDNLSFVKTTLASSFMLLVVASILVYVVHRLHKQKVINEDLEKDK